VYRFSSTRSAFGWRALGMRTRHRSGRPMKFSTLRSMPFSAIQRAKVP
jgi:hypothetical protein